MNRLRNALDLSVALAAAACTWIYRTYDRLISPRKPR
jgi:hypothetical protein